MLGTPVALLLKPPDGKLFMHYLPMFSYTRPSRKCALARDRYAGWCKLDTMLSKQRPLRTGQYYASPGGCKDRVPQSLGEAQKTKVLSGNGFARLNLL
jgi:hypothetical protein